MTPLEFLSRLKKLSLDKQLTIAHLGATFEMLAPVLSLSSSAVSTVSQCKRLTTESGLAKSLGEPIAIIEQWRIPGITTPQMKYRFGPVLEWILDHITPIFSSAVNTDGKSDLQFSDIAPSWKMQIPVMKVDEKLIGFFRSVAEECVPLDYAMVATPTLPFSQNKITREEILEIIESLTTLSEFSIEVAKPVNEAREIYAKLKGSAIPDVRLQFFRSALLHDEKLAREIADTLDVELLRKGFNISQWFWQQIVENDFCSFSADALNDAFELSEEYGINLNQLCHIRDDQNNELFEGNISHLLADTKGEFYQNHSFEQCPASYEKLLTCVLNIGLSVDKPNNNQLTARHIANVIEETHGQGQSIFKNRIEKYESAIKMEATLKAKGATKKIKRSF